MILLSGNFPRGEPPGGELPCKKFPTSSMGILRHDVITQINRSHIYWPHIGQWIQKTVTGGAIRNCQILANSP
jgi:hypothetical protein